MGNLRDPAGLIYKGRKRALYGLDSDKVFCTN